MPGEPNRFSPSGAYRPTAEPGSLRPEESPSAANMVTRDGRLKTREGSEFASQDPQQGCEIRMIAPFQFAGAIQRVMARQSCVDDSIDLFVPGTPGIGPFITVAVIDFYGAAANYDDDKNLYFYANAMRQFGGTSVQTIRTIP